MSKTYYTASDIEDLALSGVTQLEIGPGVAVTDVAREMAEERGIKLVRAGSASPTSNAASPAQARPAAAAAASKPRGCQHGPLAGIESQQRQAGAAAPKPDGVVNRLVDVVSKLARQGG